MASADLYALLGVAPTASTDEIKRAYRKLARELHPDANPGDAAAEAKFKEVSQAYEILSDPDRRANYDRFGQDGMDPNFGGSVQDIFDLFFGNMGQPQRRRGPQPGPDAETVLELTLLDAAFGAKKEVTVTLPVTCAECNGKGAAAGTQPMACTDCQGTGQVRRVRNSFLGQMVTTSPCPRCGGLGETISSPCPGCQGDGRQRATRSYTIEVPAGIEDGSTMRLQGRGPAGPRGGANGTLYVHLRIADDPRFERHGDDLHHEAHVSITQAALGATLTVPTLDGTATVEVPRGSQHGDVFTIRHEGVHHLRGRGRGDLFVHLAVEIPTELDHRTEQLLKELAQILDGADGTDVSDDTPRRKRRGRK